MLVKNKNLKILTPSGFENFYGIKETTKSCYYHLKFTNGKELKCSENHALLTIDGFKEVKNIKKTDEIIFKDNDNGFITQKLKIKKNIKLYDIVNAGVKKRYYTNDVISHNCTFLGSLNTLINAKKLNELRHDDPILKSENLDIYENPKKDRIYMITVDVSEGAGIDYSAFVIIDITEIPYKMVGKYKSNTIKPMVFPTTIKNVANKYNKAFILLELNSLGGQVASILFYDLEYSNMLMVATKGRHGQILGQGFSNKSLLGLKINKSTKQLGCSNLKALIESDKLYINDFDTISELTTFIETKGTFKADVGYHDDLISSLIVFAWASTQPYFKELTNLDVRTSILENQINSLEEEFNLFGIYDDGYIHNIETDINGDVWTLDSNFHKLNTNIDPLYEYGYTSTEWEIN